MVLMHAIVLDAEKKQSRCDPTSSVVMADGKRGKRKRKKEVRISNGRKKK